MHLGNLMRVSLSAALIGVLALIAAGAALAGGGNSGNAHLCQQNGWQTLAPSPSAPPFSNEGACTSFGAQGGTLVSYAADLELSVVLADPANATVTVANKGPHDATNVQILVNGSDDSGAWSVDYPDFGWTFVSFGNCSRCVVFSRPSIAAGSSATFPLQQNIGSGTISAEVYASDQPDPDSTPNNGVVTEDDFISVELAA